MLAAQLAAQMRLDDIFQYVDIVTQGKSEDNGDASNSAENFVSP